MMQIHVISRFSVAGVAFLSCLGLVLWILSHQLRSDYIFCIYVSLSYTIFLWAD